MLKFALICVFLMGLTQGKRLQRAVAAGKGPFWEHMYSSIAFLVANKRHYKRLCPSVRPSVRNPFLRNPFLKYWTSINATAQRSRLILVVYPALFIPSLIIFQNGAIKLNQEQKCPLDEFELVLWSSGSKGKSYSICPFCYNNPPFKVTTFQLEIILWSIWNHDS